MREHIESIVGEADASYRVTPKYAPIVSIADAAYGGPALFRNPSPMQGKIESEFNRLYPEMAEGLVAFLIGARSRSTAVETRHFWHSLSFLRYAFAYSTEDFCVAVGLSKSSWDRKLYQETVAKPVYDRVFVLARLYAVAHDVLDSVADVRTWFTHPLPALGGDTPKAFAIGEPGTGTVLNLLEAMREGSYS